jgi:hypothetical protein
MMQALLVGVVVFVLVFAVLSLFEIIIHHLLHWKSKNYRYGVWLFAILAALYAYVTSLGR